MKPCHGTYCSAVVSNHKRLCDACLSKAFQARAKKAGEPIKKPGGRPKGSKNKVVKAKPPVSTSHRESDKDFVDDSPRYATSYEAQYVDNARDSARNTGRTTALALQALGVAIAQRGRITYAEDHYPGRAGQTALLSRIQSIADALGWPVEAQPEVGSHYRVQLTSRYVPPKVWGL